MEATLKKNVNLLLFYTSLMMTTNFMYQVVFNLFLRDLGIPNSAIGNITSAALWGSALLGLAVSVAADMIGRKKMLVLAAVIVPICGIAMAFTTNFAALWIFSFLKGGFRVVGHTVILAAMASFTGTGERARMFGLNAGLMMGSGVLGNFLGGLVGDLAGMQSTLVLSMIMHLTCLIPAIAIDAPQTRSKMKDLFDFKGLNPEQRKILGYFFSSTLAVGFGAGLFIHFGNLIFRDLFALSATLIGVILSISQLGTAVGSSLSHVFGRRFGPLKFVLVMQVMVVPLMLAMAFIREPFTFTTFYSLRFVFMNITTPILSSVTFSFLPANKLSTISGINGLLNNVARAIAAMMFGYVVGVESEGYTSLFLVSAAFYAVGAIVAFLIFREFENNEITKSLYQRPVSAGSQQR